METESQKRSPIEDGTSKEIGKSQAEVTFSREAVEKDAQSLLTDMRKELSSAVPFVRSICKELSKEELPPIDEDLTQEVFLRFLENIKRHPEHSDKGNREKLSNFIETLQSNFELYKTSSTERYYAG